jgi:hypothetical protein
MLGLETVAECMADYFVGHHPAMQGSRKAAQAVDAARCLEDSAHSFIMTSVPHPGKRRLRRVRSDYGCVTGNTETARCYGGGITRV